MMFKPISKPVVVDDVYTQDQVERLFHHLRTRGPWRTITANHFNTPEEMIATTSGVIPDKAMTWDGLVGPSFRDNLGIGGAVLFPDLEDVYHNPKFLELARQYWGAEYSRPELMLFNIALPSTAGPTPHFDAMDFRGVVFANTPIWLLNSMAKSGLFTRWMAKKAQVITWFYRGQVEGGFTYWPDGVNGPAQRLHAPMWNRGVVVQNENMFHKGDDIGPMELRGNEGLAYQSLCEADPDREGHWRVTTDGRVIKQIAESEVRFLFHWGAEVFMDKEELRRALEHTDDLTHDMVFDIFIKDLRARGVDIAMPTDPMTDANLIRAINNTYQVQVPRVQPEEEAAFRLARAG